MRTEIYGPFEVLERLGVGGMATVHRAIERGIDGFERVVALKRLLPHLAEDEDFVRSFVREAKLASLLQHGNIVQLYELGRVGSSYFISMEYIPGRDLRVILRQARRVSGPPPVEISIAILTELLDALDYAHTQCGSDGKPLGLIHRDISPANLIVGHTGHLKVIDFGIAKVTFGHLMTNSGRIKGKLAYMAPEALAGRPLDGRSDLFSASIIAHELLTAAPLFAAKDDFKIIERLQSMQPTPPSARNPNCPPELDEIVLRGLAKNPEDRWPSAAEMRTAIGEVAVHHRLRASNREVCSWVEESFQRSPAVATSRIRLPLAPPPGGQVSGERRNSTGEADDEIMDIVWGSSSPHSIPVVLDDVPDVTSKLPLPAASAVDGPEPHPVHRSEASLVLGTSATMPARNTGMLAGFGPGKGATSQSASWGSSASNLRQVVDPTGWALGTSPTTQHQPTGIMEEAMWAARRAEAMAMAAMATQRRRSPIPLVVASAAVVAAAATIGVFIVGRNRAETSSSLAAATGEGARIPSGRSAGAGGYRATTPSGTAAGGAPRAAAVVPAPPSNAGAASPAQSAIVLTPAPTAPSATRLPGEGESSQTGADDRADRQDDRHTHRPRSKREIEARALGDGERPKEEREMAAVVDARAALELDKSDKVEKADKGDKPDKSIQDSQASPVEHELDPLPVPVQPPVTKPAEPVRPARSGEPIIISASRAQRESGNSRPIRFPPGEQLPPKIVAKLCIDPRGSVTTVTVLSQVSAKVRHAVERALVQWRYRPIVEAGETVSACFATAFPVQLD